MSQPVNIPLAAHYQGDRWPGISAIGPVLVNGSTPAGALARIRMQFRNGSNLFTFDSDPAQSPDAPITISNAATWLATVPAVEGFLSAASGQWSWDMEFYETGVSGHRTFYSGTLLVKPDTTKP